MAGVPAPDADRGVYGISTAAELVGMGPQNLRLYEARGLLERRPCDADARAINAVLTPAGLELASAAQATHLAAVRERFFDRLSDAEVATLATVFLRFSPDAAGGCTA